MKPEVSQQHYSCLKFRAFQSDREKSSKISQRMFYSQKNCWDFFTGEAVPAFLFSVVRWQAIQGSAGRDQTVGNRKGPVVTVIGRSSCSHTSLPKKWPTYNDSHPVQEDNLYTWVQATSLAPARIPTSLPYTYCLNGSGSLSNYHWVDPW